VTLKGQGEDLKHLRLKIWTTVQTAAMVAPHSTERILISIYRYIKLYIQTDAK